jgi:alpha-galactosidase
VEIPVVADRQGLHPCYVGNLPAQCAALCRTHVNVQELVAQAVLHRDRDAALHALMLDPITARALPLGKIREMFEKMWAAEGDLLDYWN